MLELSHAKAIFRLNNSVLRGVSTRDDWWKSRVVSCQTYMILTYTLTPYDVHNSIELAFNFNTESTKLGIYLS